MSRKAQRVGASFEAAIESLADLIPGVVIHKQHTKTAFVGPGQVVSRGKGRPDFMGAAWGVPILFDAKSTQNKNRLTMPEKRRHQFEEMQTALSAGFVSFYLVEWRDSDTYEVFPVTAAHVWPFVAVRGKGVASANGGGNWLQELLPH